MQYVLALNHKFLMANFLTLLVATLSVFITCVRFLYKKLQTMCYMRQNKQLNLEVFNSLFSNY